MRSEFAFLAQVQHVIQYSIAAVNKVLEVPAESQPLGHDWPMFCLLDKAISRF